MGKLSIISVGQRPRHNKEEKRKRLKEIEEKWAKD